MTTEPVTEQTPHQQFVAAFNALAVEVHDTAKSKGWWVDRDALIEVAKAHSPELGRFAELAVAATGIALKTSELSEALEGLRHGNQPDDKVPEFTAEEAEYADCIIRIMDTAAQKGIRVAEALVAKMDMNKGRSIRHGGKSF